MDGLSSAASVIAVIQGAQSVASGLKNYYEGVRDARADIRKLYNSIKGLEAILSTIQELLNRGMLGWPSRSRSLSRRCGSLKPISPNYDLISKVPKKSSKNSEGLLNL
jgi:hypothetical protein